MAMEVACLKVLGFWFVTISVLLLGHLDEFPKLGSLILPYQQMAGASGCLGR